MDSNWFHFYSRTLSLSYRFATHPLTMNREFFLKCKPDDVIPWAKSSLFFIIISSNFQLELLQKTYKFLHTQDFSVK